MPHHLTPHTREWFAALEGFNPQQARHTRAILTAAGRDDVCSVCGDDPAVDYQIIFPTPQPQSVATIRLCDDCRLIREMNCRIIRSLQASLMKRATKYPGVIFQKVLKQAEEQLVLIAEGATNFQHRGIRGDERANSLRQFLSSHLPSVFSTGKGEAIDYRDNRTGEIDFCIYDAARSSPIQSSSENVLLPAEAVYAVVEVKSILTQDELDNAAVAARKVRSLKPFKKDFVPSPTNGEIPRGYRCLYIVFAYTSNLSADHWAQKEFERIKSATSTAGGLIDMIDRVIVLDRGMIRPQVGAAVLRDEATGIFLEFYVHLVNFLTRERRRRPEIDWMAYTPRSSWVKLS